MHFERLMIAGVLNERALHSPQKNTTATDNLHFQRGERGGATFDHVPLRSKATVVPCYYTTIAVSAHVVRRQFVYHLVKLDLVVEYWVNSSCTHSRNPRNAATTC